MIDTNTLILGLSGMGKSKLFATYYTKDLKENKPFILFNLGYESIPTTAFGTNQNIHVYKPWASDNDVSIDLFTNNYKSSLNDLVIGILEIVKDLFDPKGEGLIGPQIERRLATVAAVLQEHGSLTIDSLFLLTNKLVHGNPETIEYIEHIKDAEIKAQYKQAVNEFVNQDGTRKDPEAIYHMEQKLAEYISTPIMKRFLNTTFNTDRVPMSSILAEKKTLIIDLAKSEMGETAPLFFARLVLLSLLLSRRSDKQKQPYAVYIDRLQDLNSSLLVTALVESKPLKLNITMVLQFLDMLGKSNELKDAIFGNTGKYVLFKTSRSDSSFMSKYLRTPELEAKLSNLQVDEHLDYTTAS